MNLIICGTPFQVLLAEKIIDLYPNENFYGIMYQVGKGKNHKYEHYYSRLASKCMKSEYFIFSENTKIEILYNNISMRFKYILLPKISKLFLANIQTDIVHMLLSGVKANELYTFDDGIGSLVSNDRYNKQTKSLYRMLVDFILQNKYSPKKIIDKVTNHFTIYDSMMNFEGRLIKINLIQPKYKPLISKKYSKHKSIFIGQPIYESIQNKGDCNNIHTTKRIIEFFNIDYYFPHPRENYKIDDVEYINTNLIFEDYILNVIDKEPDIQYTIYTFLSGAALNLINVPSLKIICIQPNDLNDFWNRAYSMFENNVEIIPWKV